MSNLRFPLQTRDPERNGVTVSVHPWATGRDALPDWEEPMRRVPIIVDVAHLRKDLLRVTSAQRLTHDAYNRYISLVEEAKALQWAGPPVARHRCIRSRIALTCVAVRTDVFFSGIGSRCTSRTGLRGIASSRTA